MAKSQVQSAVAPHGNSANAAIMAAGPRAIRAFNERQEFADEEILVAVVTVARIDVETGVRVGRDDQKFAKLVLLPKILNQIPSTGADEHLLVFAQAVKKIKDRIAPRLARIVTGRQNRAVANRVAENFAANRAAFNAAQRSLGGLSQREAQKSERRKKYGAPPAIHIAAPQRDSNEPRAKQDTAPPP